MNATTQPSEYELNNNQLRVRTIKAIYESHQVKEEEKTWLTDPIVEGGQVYEMFKHLENETKEYFIALHLDAKNKVLCKDVVSIGSMTASIVNPREVLKTALLSSAAGMIFIHNHPSGDPIPSNEDRAITEKLKIAAELFNIRVLDHIIIGQDTFFSFKDRTDILY